MSEFPLITNHGLVLLAIAKRPHSTARDIGDAVGITERATHRIINDLEAAGYMAKIRIGRRNKYRIHPEMPLKGKARSTVGELLTLLGWKPRRASHPEQGSSLTRV